MTDSEIRTVHELYQMARSHSSGHFVYRGEDSTSYVLRPKFGRVLAKAGFATPDHEVPMLRHFEREAVPHLSTTPADDWEWLSIAQHHGLTTRLLDWTSNPLVAAFFACNRQREDSIIYAFDANVLPPASLDTSPFGITQDALFHPRHTSARITAQAGLFSVHADPARSFAPPGLQRHVLKREMLIDLEGTLRTFDVHRARLFPGLDSLAHHVNSSYGAD